jgi:hypothetical protein
VGRGNIEWDECRALDAVNQSTRLERRDAARDWSLACHAREIRAIEARNWRGAAPTADQCDHIKRMDAPADDRLRFDVERVPSGPLALPDLTILWPGSWHVARALFGNATAESPRPKEG